MQSNLTRIDVGWIIIGEIKWSTTNLVTDRRCQRKGAKEDERVSLRSVRPASTSTSTHLNTGTEAPMLTTPCKERAALAMEERPWSHGSNVSVKNKLIGASTSVVFGVQKKRNAAMRLDVWSDLHKRSDAW